MNLHDFKQSLEQEAPPTGLNLTLQALWLAGKNDWQGSHNLLQNDESANGSWVHAYLHREEGDIPNARHWYSKAGKTIPSVSLKEEWDDIATALLSE